MSATGDAEMLYGYERCSHEGIGMPGCPTCDPDRHRVAARADFVARRALRAKTEELLEMMPASPDLPRLRTLHVEGSTMEMTLEGGKRVLGMIVQALATCFEGDGGINYVQYQVQSGSHDYTLVLQRAGGKTPHELRTAAEVDLERVQREMEALRARLREEREKRQEMLAELDALRAERLELGGDQ